jgi:hypothetical protein
LERENRELRQANEILRKASAYFAQAELDRLTLIHHSHRPSAWRDWFVEIGRDYPEKTQVVRFEQYRRQKVRQKTLARQPFTMHRPVALQELSCENQRPNRRKNPAQGRAQMGSGNLTDRDLREPKKVGLRQHTQQSTLQDNCFQRRQAFRRSANFATKPAQLVLNMECRTEPFRRPVSIWGKQHRSMFGYLA